MGALGEDDLLALFRRVALDDADAPSASVSRPLTSAWIFTPFAKQRAQALERMQAMPPPKIARAMAVTTVSRQFDAAARPG